MDRTKRTAVRAGMRPTTTATTATNGINGKKGPGRVASPMYLASLHSTTMVDTKPFLPAEILTMILDYLPIPDLLHFARTSRRMQEMVYEDARWIQRLKLMGSWDEAEARQRVEEALKRKLEAQKARETEEGQRPGHARQGSLTGVGGASGRLPLRDRQPSLTLFDQGWEQQRQQSYPVIQPPGVIQLDVPSFTSTPSSPYTQQTPHSSRNSDPIASLTVLKRVRSVRGHARQEFGKIYAALAPFYNDLVRSRSHTDPVVFRVYTDPEQQAQMLTQLRAFTKSDMADGWKAREDTLESMIGIFENAVLREFEQGYGSGDASGRMRKYAHVLVALNGGAAAIDLYIHNHRIFLEKDKLGSPLDCLGEAGAVNLNAIHSYFQRLSLAFNEESGRIEQVFPPTADVQLPLLDRASDEIISEYVTTLFDEAHQMTMESYLKVVAAVYQQCIQFTESLRPAAGSQSADFHAKVMAIVNRCFEPHIDLYLQEEFDYFKSKCNAQVQSWERKLSEQEASDESFFMSNVNRSAAKRDFMASFKSVLMLPVNAVQTIPRPAFATSKPTVSAEPSRPSTPNLNSDAFATTHDGYLPQRAAAPTSELAAKAALMNSKLEGISALFSLEVALSLVHIAKASIERAGLFLQLGDQSGEEAKEQCQAIFVELLQVLGFRHIKPGFDKAVGYLSSYNARDASEHSDNGVRPLVIFLELVNVGDLIQQMVDVFYAQELVATKLSDRDDFLDAAVKEKKRFEQMLDERVAAGLNKGIDVLMDEVEYVCATTQTPADYNPGGSSTDAEKNMVFDIGPSATAIKVVELVSSHTNMLVGSADKNMLDVFNQEVGLRLFTAVSKHLKRQRISTDGAIKLISDTNHYAAYIATLRNKELLQYFSALREVSQIFLVDGRHAKEIAAIVADADRYGGIVRAEEVLEFAERRADWYLIRGNVEKAMFGIGCVVM